MISHERDLAGIRGRLGNPKFLAIISLGYPTVILACSPARPTVAVTDHYDQQQVTLHDNHHPQRPHQQRPVTAHRAKAGVRPLKATDPIPASLTDLPPVIPLQVASRILGIGKNYGYKLVRSGEYPVRVIDSHGRFKVSKFDLLRYLGALTRES